jgi:Arc/MetJ-type ribon-helix-helix transcriptional regulator
MQITLESPYDEYIQKLIESGQFESPEQVVQFALDQKLELHDWDGSTVQLLEERLKEIEAGNFDLFDENYKDKVIEGAKLRLLNNEPIAEYLKP